MQYNCFFIVQITERQHVLILQTSMFSYNLSHLHQHIVQDTWHVLRLDCAITLQTKGSNI